MATHAAPEPLRTRLRDSRAWQAAPRVLAELARAGAVVALAVILISTGEDFAGLALLFLGLGTHVGVLCWQAMRSAWDKLDADEPRG